MSIADLARREIRRLRPYEAAVQVTDTVRLNANEAPWTSGADRFIRPLNRYPEIRPERLRATLANRFGCGAAQLLVTRGTSEAIDLLMRVFCRAGQDTIVTTAPTFSMYRHYAVIQGAGIDEVDTCRDRDFAVTADAVVEACKNTTRLVFLCSPNNPTGTSIARPTIVEILERTSGRCGIVVDEAYIEFSSGESSLSLLGRFDNLIVLRTLSKALAFAGARCGAVIARPEVIGMLDAVQAPYAFATPVVECVEKALEDRWLNEAERRVREVIRERKRLGEALSNFSFVTRLWPSDANFILVQVSDAAALMQQTRNNGLLLRHFSGALADCVRITVGSAEENTLLLKTLSAFEAGRD